LLVRYAELESLWMGETPKNVAAIFRTARNDGAVLLFDEADAIRRAAIDLGRSQLSAGIEHHGQRAAAGARVVQRRGDLRHQPRGELRFNMYFHTDGETTEKVPWTGLEASTRAYARIIDEGISWISWICDVHMNPRLYLNEQQNVGGRSRGIPQVAANDKSCYGPNPNLDTAVNKAVTPDFLMCLSGSGSRRPAT
jgi:ATPase family associated with various cellular activities (AAA)